MPITAVCEYCFKEYQVKSAFAGRTGKLGHDGVTYFIGSRRRKLLSKELVDVELDSCTAAYLESRPRLQEFGRWPISIGNHPGIELRLVGPGHEDRVRFFIFEDDILMQSVSAENTRLPKENMRRFFDSLTVDGQPVEQGKENP